MKYNHTTPGGIYVLKHTKPQNQTYGEIKRKIIRFFRPEITAKMGPTHLSSCWRNNGTQSSNHTQIFWLCAKLCAFWRKISDDIKDVFKVNIQFSPKVAKINLLNMILIVALKCITIRWLKADFAVFKRRQEPCKNASIIDHLKYQDIIDINRWLLLENWKCVVMGTFCRLLN